MMCRIAGGGLSLTQRFLPTPWGVASTASDRSMPALRHKCPLAAYQAACKPVAPPRNSAFQALAQINRGSPARVRVQAAAVGEQRAHFGSGGAYACRISFDPRLAAIRKTDDQIEDIHDRGGVATAGVV